MVFLVSAETLILVLLSLLVVGLLRSHAEILRRLQPSGESPAPPQAARGVEALPKPRRRSIRAPEIVGTTLEGYSAIVAPAGGGQSSLVAFLSSGCSTCQGFWDAFRPEVRQPVPGDARLILVTKDSNHESPSRLRDLAPMDVPLVMSSPAWDDYQVPLTPYFVYVDGATGRITGEGAAEAWPQIVSLVRDALADRDHAESTVAAGNGAATNGATRLGPADAELEAAGLRPGHPSLYGPGDPTAG